MAQNPKYKVIVSDKAKQMLGAHVRFLTNVDRNAAVSLKNKIMTALRTLEELPERYPFFHEIFIPPNKYHKMVVEKQYLVLYQIKDSRVYVDYILDCRQDYNWLIH